MTWKKNSRLNRSGLFRGEEAVRLRKCREGVWGSTGVAIALPASPTPFQAKLSIRATRKPDKRIVAGKPRNPNWRVQDSSVVFGQAMDGSREYVFKLHL
ncbi:hypothetical protein D3C85_1460180 [compost metagenome]